MEEDKRNKLQELAMKKRKEMEEAAQAEQQKKKAPRPALIDFGESDDEEALPEPEDEEPSAPAGARIDEEGEGDLVRTAEDDDFIDDEGVAPEQRVDFGVDDVPEGGYAEAEEGEEDDMEDELDRLFNKRGRRENTGTDAQNRAMVENLLAQMEVAVEEDLRAFENRKPALNKLRLLARVEEVLAMRKLHGELLDSGLLGVLKAWIEPMPDGTLPNSKIRSSVLNMLTRLPVDCSFEDRKEQLKRSGLGRIIMFLSKLPDELPANRRVARELVDKWSRPILAPRRDKQIEEEEMQRILEARQARERAQRASNPVPDDGDLPTAQLRPGQAGFRYHAHIPQAASLDYVNKPVSKVASLDKKSSGKNTEHRLTKKLRSMGKVSSKRAADVKVEGRNVTLMK